MSLKTRMKRCFTLLAFCTMWPFGACAMQQSTDFAAPQMKRATKVVFDEVKTNPDQTATAVAVLTYEDGTTARCKYKMRYELSNVGGRYGMRFSPQSENCVPIK